MIICLIPLSWTVWGWINRLGRIQKYSIHFSNNNYYLIDRLKYFEQKLYNLYQIDILFIVKIII